MKRIVCLILCLLTVITCCSVTISAATEDTTSDVMNELSQMTIDGKKFDEADYPKDSSKAEMSIIAVKEIGFESISYCSNFQFFVYVYNPSCMDVADSIDNGITIGIGANSDNYIPYRLVKRSATTDSRFMKFMVAKRAKDVSLLYQGQQDANNRVYSITTLYMKVESDIETFKVIESFCFSGLDSTSTLTCNRVGFEGLEVELHDTNWISPNAGVKTDGSASTIYDHYEINSVYFAVPNTYFADNTDLISILASFDRIRLTPIIIGRPSKFGDGKGLDTKNAILDGRNVVEEPDPDIYDIAFVRNVSGLASYEADAIYTENLNLRSYFVANGEKIYKRLAYYFENEELPDDFEFEDHKYSAYAISSEELEKYFYERYEEFAYGQTDPNLGYLYTERIPQLVDYKHEQIKMSTFVDGGGYSNYNWWEKLRIKEDSYVFEDFEVDDCYNFEVIDPTKYTNYDSLDKAEVANDLYISELDLKEFSGVCAQAAANDCKVVLLRFGFSDYTCAPTYDVLEAMPNTYSSFLGAYVERWAYMDITVARLTFQHNGEKIVVPVCSNSIDSFGDTILFENPDMLGGDSPDFGGVWRNLWAKLKNILKVIGIILLVVVLLPILWPILKIVVQFAGSVFSGISDGIKKRRERKQNDQNKKE